ncbi:MAG: Panacea domain-containing protein [Pseudomonadota bacterium]
MSYNPQKAAQTVAYLSLKNNRRPLNILKAVKLVYLADRESVRRFGFPIQDETHYSMPQGPVNSTTYRHLRGEVPPDQENGWGDVLSDRHNHKVGLANDEIDADDLDELSDADIAVLDAVWNEFGGMNQWQLVDWTHDANNVPEWEDPNGSSNPIPLRRMMDALGIENVVEQETVVHDSQRASAFLKAL